MAQSLTLSQWQHNLKDRPISKGLSQIILHKYLQTLLPVLIVFFSTANVGLRRLHYFCNELLNYYIPLKQIKWVIDRAAQNAEGYLAKWDKIAGEQTRVLEIDTTWKGKMRKFFGAIAKDHRYLFILTPIRNEKAATLQPIMEHLAKVCINLKYIISDMAIGFKGLIRRIFSTVIHLFCHVHISRLFHREWSEEYVKFSKVRTQLQKARIPVRNTLKWLRKNRKRYNNINNYFHKLQKIKLNWCLRLGIVVNPNGSIRYRRGGLHPNLTKISIRINHAQMRLHRYRKQTKKQQVKLPKTVIKYRKQLISYQLEWSKAMIPAKIRKLLYKTLHAPTLGQFKRKSNLLKRKLKGSTFEGRKKLIKILSSTPFNNTAKTYLVPETERFSISTNTIEGFFAQCRMLLDELRNAPDTSHIRSRLTLLRYWHNAIGPLSGFDANISPCSRVGIRFGSKNPIRLICTNIHIPLNLSS